MVADDWNNFDWVDARSSCTLAIVFQKLKLDITADVQSRNGLRGDAPSHVFTMASRGEDTFFVMLEGIKTTQESKIVKFVMTSKAINVSDGSDNPISSATLTLANDGKCRLKVGPEKELEFWQFRRLTLEKLFFEIV